jgi:hypothetical protein
MKDMTVLMIAAGRQVPFPMRTSHSGVETVANFGNSSVTPVGFRQSQR